VAVISSGAGTGGIGDQPLGTPATPPAPVPGGGAISGMGAVTTGGPPGSAASNLGRMFMYGSGDLLVEQIPEIHEKIERLLTEMRPGLPEDAAKEPARIPGAGNAPAKGRVWQDSKSGAQPKEK